MKTKNPFAVVMFSIVAVFAGSAVAEGEFLLHGRISFDTGGLTVKSPQENEWSAAVVNTLVMPGDTLWVDEQGTAEVELAGSNFLRFADSSKAEVVTLPPDALIRGWVGSFYVQRLARSAGEFIFTAPAGIVDIAQDSMVRMDIDAKGALTVSVRWGRAVVRTEQGGDVTATDATRVWVEPGFLPSEAVPFDRAQDDAFDSWNGERAHLLSEGLRTTPKEVIVQNNTVGAHDLNRYGEWVYVDSRPYWRPTVVVNYVPYRCGYWNYMPAVGHVWVDEYPFAYVTTHYGRWCHNGNYGWLWSYDPVWSPAWVTSVRVADYYVWAPVDYYCRPVMVMGAATFSLGGLSFCWGSTSYVSSAYLYAGPAFVYSPASVWVNTICAIPPRNIHIWNITPDIHRRPESPFDPRYIAGRRDYNPPRSIRGISGEAGVSLAPTERALRLERNLGRESFATVRTGSATALRTSGTREGGLPSPRSVRLNQTEQTYLTRQNTNRSSAVRTASLVPESQRLGRRTDTAGEITGITTPPLSEQTETASDLTARSGSGVSVGRTPRTITNRTDIAVRDLESAAPAPRGSGQIQRTPVPATRSIRQQSGEINTLPVQENSSSTGLRTAPPTSLRATPNTESIQRRGPATSLRTPPNTEQIEINNNTRSNSLRSAPTTSLRAAPNTESIQRRVPATSLRTPPNTEQIEINNNAGSNSLRTAPSTSLRATPNTESIQRRGPATSLRSAPNTQQIEMNNSIRSNSLRTAPSQSMQLRSMPAPSVRSAPSPIMQNRSMSGPSLRSAPSPIMQQHSSPPTMSNRSGSGMSSRGGDFSPPPNMGRRSR